MNNIVNMADAARVLTAKEWSETRQAQTIERAFKMAEQGQVEAIQFTRWGTVERIEFWAFGASYLGDDDDKPEPKL